MNSDELRPGLIWAPVRCEDTPAYVRWRDTMLMTVVKSDGTGLYRLVQVVLVECDAPIFEHWRYNADGKQAIKPSKRTSSGRRPPR